MNPASLANLIPYKPGDNGNPSGRAKGVHYPGDYLRDLTGATEEALRAIKDDPAAPAGQRIAAGVLWDGVKADGPDIRGRTADRIMDRTEGRPSQSVDIKAQVGPDPALMIATRLTQELDGVLGAGGTPAGLIEAGGATDEPPDNESGGHGDVSDDEA